MWCRSELQLMPSPRKAALAPVTSATALGAAFASVSQPMLQSWSHANGPGGQVSYGAPLRRPEHALAAALELIAQQHPAASNALPSKAGHSALGHDALPPASLPGAGDAPTQIALASLISSQLLSLPGAAAGADDRDSVTSSTTLAALGLRSASATTSERFMPAPQARPLYAALPAAASVVCVKRGLRAGAPSSRSVGQCFLMSMRTTLLVHLFQQATASCDLLSIMSTLLMAAHLCRRTGSCLTSAANLMDCGVM